MAMLVRIIATFSSFAISYFFLLLGPLLSFFIAVAVLLALSNRQYLLVCIRTAPRDLRALSYLTYIKLCVTYYIRTKQTIPILFEKTVKKYGDKTALICEDQTWTFRQLDLYANSVGHFFLQNGFRTGDVVAIFAESSPTYVGLWLGLAKVGLVPALVNFNLRAEPLLHSFQAANAKAVLFSSSLSPMMAEIEDQLANFDLFCFGGSARTSGGPPSVDFDRAVRSCPQDRPSLALPPIQQLTFALPTTTQGPLFFIFTSGTTGMPKAAIITHVRYFFMAMNCYLFFRITPTDVLYTPLPLYHTAGGILGTGQMLLNGVTMVIKKKFSASRFWSDCVTYRCTVAQYIGELCRYLLAQPVKPEETQHQVRLAYGNGLRPQIWEEVQRRFRIRQIGELYGATESNANLINPDNKVGAVGFLTRILPALYPVRLIKVDEATGEPLRDTRSGLCQVCEPFEPGELVGKIVRGDPLRSFDGYVCKEATKKKIVTDVFSKGDMAFISGDILEMDELGYVYFRDRTGDTFRWRGENVSTSEVESIISTVLQLADCVVYGVMVPGLEGRAGMAAIALENGFSETDILQRLIAELPRHLPPYARPVFIRFVSAIESTGTFKLKKIDLAKQGFQPNGGSSDKIFVFDQRIGEYLPVTAGVHADIVQQRMRL